MGQTPEPGGTGGGGYGGGGYGGGRNWVKWIIIYLIVGGLVYLGIWYFALRGGGGYG